MEKPSCWICRYHQAGGINLLGKCKWFEEKKGQEAKDIPAKIVDIGCKLWEQKRESCLG